MGTAFRPLRTLPAAVAAAFLGACALQPMPAPQTPGQAWYAADAAYAVVLESAVAYRRECLARPRALQDTCRAAVLRMAALAGEAEEIQEIGDLAVADGDGDLLKEAIVELERVKDRLRRQLAAELEKEGKLP